MVSATARGGSIVARLREAAVSGSHLVISHPASDVQAEKVAEVARRYNASVVTGQTRRNVAEVTASFGGWEILDPGVTQTPAWRPAAPAAVTGSVPMWAGVARKP